MERVASSCLSLLAQRRGYSVAAAIVKGGAIRRAEDKVAQRVMGKKSVNTAAVARDREEKMAWVPDPVTGYYRPAGIPKEVDPVDLRAKLLARPAK